MGAEHMPMVGHDDEAADAPTMPRARASQLADQDRGRLGLGEERPAVAGAGRHERDRRLDPCRLQAPQMAMLDHRILVETAERCGNPPNRRAPCRRAR
jgi:hypothetical protein